MTVPTTEWVREQIAIARRTDPNPGALERIALPLAEERDRLASLISTARDTTMEALARAEAADRDMAALTDRLRIVADELTSMHPLLSADDALSVIEAAAHGYRIAATNAESERDRLERELRDVRVMVAASDVAMVRAIAIEAAAYRVCAVVGYDTSLAQRIDALRAALARRP